jgi:uncharacterized membrane protein
VERLSRLEAEAEHQQQRLAMLERAIAPRRPARSQSAPGVPRDLQVRLARRPEPVAPPRRRPARPPAAEQAAQPAARAAEDSLSELIGGRVLAWVGGVAVLAGVLFFLAMAVSRGWIGPGVRVLLAAAGASALLVVGWWLHEHRGRTEAAAVAAAAALASQFATITVATRVYDLLPAPVGVSLALIVGGLAAALAIRWQRSAIAALGLTGALLSPVLTGAPLTSVTTVVLLFVAAACSVGVVVWRSWNWLALAVIALSAPQWADYVYSTAGPVGGMLVVSAFAVLGLVAAVGHDVRTAAAKVRSSSIALLVLNAAVAAAIGYTFLDGAAGAGAGEVWLWSLAVGHFLVSVWPRPSSAVRSALAVVGIVLADVAFALTVHGAALAVGWSAVALLFALGSRWRLSRHGTQQQTALGGGLGAHVGLVLLQAILLAPPTVLGDASGAPDGLIALTALAAACLTSGRLVREESWRIVLYALGLGAVAYLTAATLSGPELVGAWAGEGLVLARLGREGAGPPEIRTGSLAFLGAATLVALITVVPPRGLIYGVADPVDAALTLGAVALACAGAAYHRTTRSREQVALGATAGACLLYLASVILISAFQPASGNVLGGVLELPVRQQGQVLLSVMWSGVGLVALLTGLRARVGGLRAVAIGVLLLSAAKVFLYDLSALDSVYRVASFVTLGLLLLAGAYAHARLGPRGDAGEARGESGGRGAGSGART